MKDWFLPFDSISRRDAVSHENLPHVQDVLARIDQLKKQVEQTRDADKLIALSRKVNDAISQLVETGKPSELSEKERLSRDLVFLYAAQQKPLYFQKLTSYFPTQAAFFQAPVSLLKAHGISDRKLEMLTHTQPQRELLHQVDQLLTFMGENRWSLVRTEGLSSIITRKKWEDVLPAAFFVKGDPTLLHRMKLTVVGDKNALPTAYASLMPEIIAACKQNQVVPICHITQQSSLQFALYCVRASLPCILILGMDPYRASEKKYRYLNYFVDHGCALVTNELPFGQGRSSYLHVFKTAMHLSGVILVLSQFQEHLAMEDYSGRYWPVLNHCHQEDKVSLWFVPPEPLRVVTALKDLAAQDAAVILYENMHMLRQMFHAWVVKGHLNSHVVKDVMDVLANVTVIH